MNRALRHAWDLQVDLQGFAYVEDFVYVLGDLGRYHLKAPPTVADLMFIIATQDKGRYQASSLTGSGAPFDLLVRTVQGHSGAIARQIDPMRAHRDVRLDEITVLVHHTNWEHLFGILGTDKAPGILLGGSPRTLGANGNAGPQSTARPNLCRQMTCFLISSANAAPIALCT